MRFYLILLFINKSKIKELNKANILFSQCKGRVTNYENEKSLFKNSFHKIDSLFAFQTNGPKKNLEA